MSASQLSRLIDLPDSDLQQVLEYASGLSKAEAADHFKNLLGESPQAIEFISTFNSRRQDPTNLPQRQPASQSSEIDAVPKPQRGPKKKKPPLHTPAPRKVESLAPAPGTGYYKKDREDDYISGRSGASTPSNSAAGGSAFKAPPLKSSTPPPSRPPPSAAGSLISDALATSKSKSKSNPVSRTSTPGPATKSTNSTKVAITGGTPMHGASTALSDLDAAIRSLEISTNPTLSGADDVATRRCNCVATRHPLQTAAPNCLNCGKVICVKEGLGPCTFCGSPLLSPGEIQAMIKELRAERGREKMAADRDAHRRPDIAGTPRPFTKLRGGDDDWSAAEAKAREHRDKLLGFQAQNAQRTTVRDEAADFDVSDAVVGGSGSMWASPEERARELRKQQKLLREMEWNARPDYEKRRQVVSIDLAGRKVVKKMMAVERPPSPEEEPEDGGGASLSVLGEADGNRGAGAGGAFSKNPLLGGLIKPVYDTKGKSGELEGRKDAKTRWRRVQDDLDDNEAVILDGGVYGGETATGIGDEPDCRA